MKIHLDGDTFTIAALGPQDPRWRVLDDAEMGPKFGVLYNCDSLNLGCELEYAGTCYSIKRLSDAQRFPVAADLICTQETAKRLAFEPDSCGLKRPATFVYTNLPDAASALQSAINGTPTVV